MPRATLITAFFVLLFLLHQDFWLRDDPTLVLGFLPASLAYHVGWTLLIALGWFLVTKFCWPADSDDPGPRPPSVALPNATEGGRGPKAMADDTPLPPSR